jgi:hypothetical protein
MHVVGGVGLEWHTLPMLGVAKLDAIIAWITSMHRLHDMPFPQMRAPSYWVQCHGIGVFEK